MQRSVLELIERELQRMPGNAGHSVTSMAPVSGGCISDAFQIVTNHNRIVFAKVGPANRVAMFQAEATALQAIAETKAVRTPGVLAVSASADHSLLLLEWIEAATSHDDANIFHEALARDLASLHRVTSMDGRYGWPASNFCGSTPQQNDWNDGWPDFYRDHRLKPQFELARRNFPGGKTLHRLGDRLLDRIGELLDYSAQPSLIHGDLWSGNWLADEHGQPVLIDPAASWSDREAEFGMLTLFGGLPQRFYDAYEEAWPMSDGWQDRSGLFRLYHLLNHLNLFGNSYRQKCLEILSRYVD